MPMSDGYFHEREASFNRFSDPVVVPKKTCSCWGAQFCISCKPGLVEYTKTVEAKAK